MTGHNGTCEGASLSDVIDVEEFVHSEEHDGHYIVCTCVTNNLIDEINVLTDKTEFLKKKLRKVLKRLDKLESTACL